MNLLKLRIPTLFGLFILLAGLTSGVYLTLQNQTISSRAASETSPKFVTITNIEDRSATISWQSDKATHSFVTFSGGLLENQTALDDRDVNVPTARALHHVTLKGLTPETSYQFKIVSGKFTSEVRELTTAKSETGNGSKPIIGSVLSGSDPLVEGIVYLTIDGIVTQSTVIKNLGNFIIPLSNIRTLNLSSTPSLALGSQAKIQVISEDNKRASATFIIKDDILPIPLKIGQDLDLTDTLGATVGDKNKDGVINSFDLIQKSADK